MGDLRAISRHSPAAPNVFTPVNYRPTEQCRTMVFDSADSNRYADTFDAQGVQYALNEQFPSGYHVIETPDSEGPLIRYTEQRPDGTIYVKKRKGDTWGHIYQPDEILFLGLIFQFIRDFGTGERWELIRGPAHEGTGESVGEQLLFDISG